MNTKKDVKQEWFLVDAKGKTLGRISSKIAHILQGKHKVEYIPHQDIGDFVVVINAKDIVLTGNKLADKKYYRHSGYMGGLKETPAHRVYAENPSKMILAAVKGMLPKNKLRTSFLKKLKVYNDDKHTHEAQSPKVLEL